MRFALADSAATEAAGAALGLALAARKGVVIYLHGDLGAGKTTLVRGLLRSLGITGAVRSPTYTLMEPYRVGARSFLHLDLYRLGDPLEVANLGLSDFPPQQTWWLVEWPERGDGVLPPPDAELFLEHRGGARVVELRADDHRIRAELEAALGRAGISRVDN